MLAEGVVDRVLVLAPSTTIEKGLTEKFKQLSADADLLRLNPSCPAPSMYLKANLTREKY